MVRLDDDDFWCVALEKPPVRRCSYDDSDDDETSTMIASTRRSYKLRLPNTSNLVTLKLSNLPETNGICSTLGAQAWHASALLAAYLLSSREEQLNKIFFASCNNDDKTCTFLELGSGAVGLSGLALAMKVGQAFFVAARTPPRVILTDLTVDGILENLRRNVTDNHDAMQEACSSGQIPEIVVEELDWNEFEKNQQKSPTTSFACSPDKHDLRLIVGSELIYTESTALSCASVIIALLQQFPSCRVLILQVLDRHGFHSHLVPKLSKAGLHVTVEQPLDPALFERASEMLNSGSIVMGGTLDRLDYGACWIQNRTET